MQDVKTRKLLNLKDFKKKKKFHFTARTVVLILVFIVFAVYAVSLIYPLIWALINSLKDNVSYFQNSFNLPKVFQFENYYEAFMKISISGSLSYKKITLIDMFFNSLWFSLGGSFMTIAVSTMSAYVVSKYNFRLKNIVYSIAIFVMLIPIVGNLPAVFKLYNQLQIVNSPFILIAFTNGFGFAFIVLYGFFKNVSWYYAEAAFMDGATNLSVFLKIMIPQALPAIASLYIINVIGLWNDYMTPLLYLPDWHTLSSGLYVFKTMMTASTDNNYPVYLAGIMIATLPILILFSCFSDTIMANTVAGGLKG